ncbi:group II intron reverse transcriptase/maturase [Acidaminobacter sp. JC074]|uniref:group II intron reverse transcriptase/maturase n=1 Tax=Acidaminobacter sp. JC074 TaxID=2530199 RepID=UPI001F0D5779
MNVIKTNNTKEKVRKLQRKLYQSAKVNGKRKFHALYDKIYRIDILKESWKKVKSNKGSAGIDKQTIEDIEAIGVDKVLEELHVKLMEGTYNPPSVRHVEIPKGKDATRPLGIPTVKDRIVQTAMKTVLEPIFDADFLDCSYGFRPKRNQHQALEVIRKACNNKGNYVLDADIKGYFNNINHDKLMLLMEQRISDRRVLKMIRKWLKAGVMIKGDLVESEIGSPQGSSISPLLSNLYLNYMDQVWEKHYKHLGVLVRFADDFVIICKNKKNVDHSYYVVQEIMRRLCLELSSEKTKVINLWGGKEGFDFLGYHHRKTKQITKSAREYYAIERWISKKKHNRIKDVIRDITNKATTYNDIETMIRTLNLKIVGWRNYYGLSSTRVLMKIDNFIKHRLILWYNIKRKRRKLNDYYEVKKLIYSLGLKRMVVF